MALLDQIKLICMTGPGGFQKGGHTSCYIVILDALSVERNSTDVSIYKINMPE